jgi:hypothetical protein
MTIRKNKKRIDPRYFLHETALREDEKHDDKVTAAMAHIASGVMCENPDIANWGHFFSDLRLASDGDPRILGLLKELPELAQNENWDFARQTIMHLSNYYKDTGVLDWEAYNKKAQDLCRE